MTLNTIHHGDCIKGMEALPDGSVDLCFADPPFNIGFEYDVYEDNKSAAEYLEWSEQWMKVVHRRLKPTGAFWLAIGDEFAAEMKVLSRQCGFYCRSWVVWYYTFGVNCKKKFTRSHAHLFHFVKNPKSFTFNHSEILVKSARQALYNDKRAKSGGRIPDDTWILRPELLPADGTVWNVPRVAGTHSERQGFHGCQMPEEILERIIKVSSNPGELVVDPFSGSATTLAVAKKLNRQFVGWDISPEYVAHGLERLASVSP